MTEIIPCLYVGTKEEHDTAKSQGMKIVCALNRATGFVTHQSEVGWQGKGCDPASPYYLFKETPDAIYLNMIDGDDPKYIHHSMINAALEFIHRNLKSGDKVFIYCSMGESRSPSLAFMYLLESGALKRDHEAIHTFRDDMYPKYNPKRGVRGYIVSRWHC